MCIECACVCVVFGWGRTRNQPQQKRLWGVHTGSAAGRYNARRREPAGRVSHRPSRQSLMTPKRRRRRAHLPHRRSRTGSPRRACGRSRPPRSPHSARCSTTPGTARAEGAAWVGWVGLGRGIGGLDWKKRGMLAGGSGASSHLPRPPDPPPVAVQRPKLAQPPTMLPGPQPTGCSWDRNKVTYPTPR